MERLHLIISGRVQGVFFRSNTEEKARQLGLFGWVRNLSDGRVEALAEGDRASLEIFLDWCYKGSPSANVENIEANWQKSTGEFKNFRTVSSV